MKVTERDIGLILRINAFGIMSVEQVARFWKIDFSTAARRARKLVEAGVLRRFDIPMLDARPLTATKAGCDIASDPIPPMNGIRLGTFRHDLYLPDLALGLEKKFGVPFRTERQMKSLKEAGAGHLPDGLLHLSDGRRVAVELELTQKARNRLASIMDSYAGNLAIDETWYFAIDDTMHSFLTRAASNHPYIRIIRWTPPASRSRLAGNQSPTHIGASS